MIQLVLDLIMFLVSWVEVIFIHFFSWHSVFTHDITVLGLLIGLGLLYLFVGHLRLTILSFAFNVLVASTLGKSSRDAVFNQGMWLYVIHIGFLSGYSNTVTPC